MQANRDQFSMRAMCTAFKVSRSGYYAWCNKDKSACPLNRAIVRQFEQDKARAGAPSIAHALAQSGVGGRHHLPADHARLAVFGGLL